MMARGNYCQDGKVTGWEDGKVREYADKVREYVDKVREYVDKVREYVGKVREHRRMTLGGDLLHKRKHRRAGMEITQGDKARVVPVRKSFGM